MKAKLLFIIPLLLLCGLRSFGQITVGADTPSCANLSTIHLGAVYTGYVPVSTGLNTDDNFDTSVIPLGFTFNFYGTDYTSCIVGGNGVISFNIADVGGPNPWDIPVAVPDTIPGNINCYNQILGCYSDIYSPAGGTISYATIGDAPNRKFIVTFCTVPMFDPGICPSDYITFQMILFETSNNIEVHITKKDDCTAWNSGLAIQGLCDPTGTIATATPGRNATVWTAYNDGVRFTPTSPTITTAYTEASIPYAPIPYAYSTIYWYTGGALIDSGSVIAVTPSVTTTYTAVAYGCNDTTSTIFVIPGYVTYDSITGVFLPTIESISGVNPTFCGSADGSITIHGIAPHFADSFFVSVNGIPQPPVIDSANADSTVTFTNISVPGASATYSYYYTTPGGCTSNTVATVLTNPPVTAAFNNTLALGCSGDSVIVVNNSMPAGFTSQWTFGDGGTSAATDTFHVYNDGATGIGTYTITLTYQTSATDDACTSTATQTVNFNHPLSASFTSDQSSVCIGVPVTFTNTSIASAPTYSWDFGDGTSDVNPNPVHTYPNGGEYNVVLTVTDNVPCTRSATEVINVVAIDVRTGVHDTSVCLLDSLSLHAYPTVTGSVSGVNYAWTLADSLGEANDSVAKFFSIGDYTYTVTVSTIPLGCTASDTETVHSYAPVTFTGLTANQTIPFGTSVQLNADGATLYTWSPNNGTLDNPNINNPVATPTDSITVYTVYGMNAFGCLDSATVIINLSYTNPEIVASAFTPNNDGLNDQFKVGSIQNGGQLVDFRVYNRWGQQIFQTANSEIGWDGTFNGVPQDMGTYNYLIIIAHSDGTQQSYTGTVTLIR